MYDGLYKPCYLTGKTQHQQQKKNFLRKDSKRLLWCQNFITLLLTSLHLAAEVTRYQQRLNPAEPCEPCCSADPESSPSSCDDVAIKRFPSPDQRDALHSFVRLSVIGPKHKRVYLHKADPSLASPSAAVLGVRTRWTGSLQQLQQQLQHPAIYIFLLNKVRWIRLKLFIPEPNAKMIFGNKSTSIFISTAAESVRSQAGLHWAARWFILFRGRGVRVILHRGGWIIV